MEFFTKFHAYMMELDPPPLVIGGVLLAGVVLLWFAMRARTRADVPTDRLSTPARFFLVLLRFVIGWHFLIEGFEKLQSPTWSSEGYLRESVGPLAPKFRELGGDSQSAQFSLKEFDNKDLPVAIAVQWQPYFVTFNDLYKLDKEQLATARKTFDDEKRKVVEWYQKPRSVKTFAANDPDAVAEKNIPQRIEDYLRLKAEAAQIEEKLKEKGEKPGDDFALVNARAVKILNELDRDLDKQAESMATSLSTVLTDKQKAKPAPKMPPRPSTWPEMKSLPAAIADGWPRYFDAFTAHYKLTDDQKQSAAEIYDAVRASSLEWYYQPRPVKKLTTYPPEIVVEWSVPQRLEETQRLQKELDTREGKLPEQGQKGWKNWLEAKANVAKWRGELKRDLDAQTDNLRKSLAQILSAEQKAGPPPELPTRAFDWSNRLDIADAAVKYGLIAIGACLIVGLFTPLAAIAGAAMLFMFYLAMPALPYLPDSPKSEGHYLYVNKNIIEMIALLAIASLNTGRWAGLDGLLQFLNPFNWPKKKTVVVKTGQPVAVVKPVVKKY